jgi:tetratricopeptide (TPR) repeat protein
MKIPYDELVDQWRDFNFTYMVAFSSDRYNDVMKILGPDADEQTNYQRAADKASNEIVKFKNDPVEDFFAWFNRGDNLTELQDYGNAANCYDEAWKIYPTIPEDKRPWRVIWYRTGNYKAYFGAGRYQAVVDLATTTLTQMSEPYIEESYYWRARAEWELGRKQEATADFHKSLELHKDFGPTMYQMELLGIQ